MEPISQGFETSTTFEGPNTSIAPLDAYNNGHGLAVRWRMTPEELAAVSSGAKAGAEVSVFLTFLGTSMPIHSVSLTVGAPGVKMPTRMAELHLNALFEQVMVLRLNLIRAEDTSTGEPLPLFQVMNNGTGLPEWKYPAACFGLDIRETANKLSDAFKEKGYSIEEYEFDDATKNILVKVRASHGHTRPFDDDNAPLPLIKLTYTQENVDLYTAITSA